MAQRCGGAFGGRAARLPESFRSCGSDPRENVLIQGGKADLWKTDPLLGSDLEEDCILERREGNTVVVGCGVESPRGTRGTLASAGQDGACYNPSLGRWRRESHNSGSSLAI